MSDAVILSLISTAGTIVVAYFSMRTNQKVNKVETKMDDNTRVTNEVKKEVEIVKVQTDGIKDELVQKTKELGEAIGKALGREEQKNEAASEKTQQNVSDAPIKVEVVNEPLKVTTPDK